MQREDVERLIKELAEADKPLLQGTIPFTETRRRIRDAAAALRALLAERDAAFAAGQEERRVALVYDEAGNVEVYADKGVTIISVCDHTPGDRLYRLTPAPIPDGMLDGHIGHAGDETQADRLANAAAEAIAEGVDVLADPGAVLRKVRTN